MKRPGTWIRVAGRPAHFEEAGDAGPAAVFVPGLGLSTRFYEPLLSACAPAGIRLIIPDLPGFGRTGGPLTGLSVAELTEWLFDFADVLGLERPCWLGHSVGCQVALHVAAARPERVQALVLAAPTGAPVSLRLTRQFFSLPRAALREPLDLLLAVVRDYVRVLPTAYLGTWLRAGRDHPVEIAGAVHCPVLLCAGDRDPICTASFLARLAAGIPDAHLAIVPGAGHGLPRDNVEGFLGVAAPFLHAAGSASPTAAQDAGGR